jgi:nucleoside-diphosphate-sugar epimerase
LLVDAATSGQPIGLSPGNQVLDLAHVDDVVDAFLLAANQLLLAEGALNEAYLLGGERLSVRELVALVGKIFGCPVQAQFGVRPYRAREIMVPVEAVERHRLPGWQPVRRLEDTLATLRSCASSEDRSGGVIGSTRGAPS